MESTGYDLQKVYKDSLHFLMQEKHRLLSGNSSGCDVPPDNYTPGENYAGDGPEPNFGADVMFSSATITSAMTSQSTANYMSADTSGDFNIKTEPIFEDNTDDQNSSQFMSDIEIKKENMTDEEMDNEPPCTSYIDSQQTAQHEMLDENTFSSNSGPLQTEDFQIKQEPLDYDEEMDMNDSLTRQSIQLSEGSAFDDWSYQNCELSQNTASKPKIRRSRRVKKPKLDENYVSDSYVLENEDGDKNSEDYFYSDKGIQDISCTLDEGKQKNVQNVKNPGSNLVFPKQDFVKSTEESVSPVPCSFNIAMQNKVDETVEMKQIQMNIFRCSVCGALFTYNSLLQRHMKKHTNEYAFRCKFCDCGFITQYSHDLHSKLHTPDKSYQCGICSEMFQARKDLKEHHTKHKNEQNRQAAKVMLETAAAEKLKKLKETRPKSSCPFGCSICGYYASDFTALGEHVLIEHEKKKFCICEICCMKFDTNDKMICHLPVHEEGLFDCGLCGKTCPNKEDLQQHLDVHELAKPYMCTLCNAKFIALPRLQTHVANKHSVNKGYTCEHCGKQFYHENTLKNHMRVHTGEIAFKCLLCSKGFRVKERLDRHMREHEDMYSTLPYSISCTTCPVKNLNTDQSSTQNEAIEDFAAGNNSNEMEYLSTKNGNVDRNLSCVTQDTDILLDNIKSEPLEGNQEEYGKPENENAEENQIVAQSVLADGDVDVTGPQSYLSQLKERMKKKRKQGQEKVSDPNKSELSKEDQAGVEHTDTTSLTSDGDKNGNSISIETQDVKSKMGLEYSEGESANKNELVTVKMEAEDSIPDLESAKSQKLTEQLKSIVCNEIKNPLPQLGMEKIESPRKTLHSFGSSAFSIAIKKISKTPFSYEDGASTILDLQTGDFQKTLKLQMNIHQCKVCGNMFAYKNQLDKHMQKHTGEHPFKCKICKKGFSSQHSYNVHYRVHSGERPYECEICGKAFRQKHSLNCHVLTHSDAKPFECGQCDRKYRTECELKRHRQLHVKSVPYSCGVCGLDSSTLMDIEQHISKEHFEGKSFVCNICSKRFERVEDHDLHVSYHSEILDKLLCGICNKEFEDKSEMMLHLGDHILGKPFKCNLCSAKFITFADLSVHLSDHKELKVFECSFCKKEFLSESYLKVHLRIHTGELPFKCDMCNKAFRLKASLERHLRVHSGEKPFQCQYCDKTFSSSSNRLSHYATHQKEKTYKCSMCDEIFHRKGKLTAHEKEHKKKGLKNTKKNDSEIDRNSTEQENSKTKSVSLTEIPFSEPDVQKNEQQEFICIECGETCRSKFKLKKHIKLHHTKALNIKVSGFQNKKKRVDNTKQRNSGVNTQDTQYQQEVGREKSSLGNQTDISREGENSSECMRSANGPLGDFIVVKQEYETEDTDDVSMDTWPTSMKNGESLTCKSINNSMTNIWESTNSGEELLSVNNIKQEAEELYDYTL